MAYVFRQNRSDDGSGASGMGQASQGGMGNSRVEKRVGVDDSGSSNTASGGMGGAPAAPKAPADFTKSKNAGAGAILERNRGVAQDSVVRRVGADAVRALEGNQAQLSQRQNDYLTKGRAGIAETTRGPSDDEVVAGLKDGKSGNLGARLNAAPVTVQNFDAGQYAPVEAMDYLRTGDVGGLIGRESGSNYTSGMGALDSIAFDRSGAGQALRSQVGNMQSQFSGELEKALGKEGATAVLKREAEKANEDSKANLRGQIERIAGGITGQLAGRREAAAKQNAEAIAKQKGEAQNQLRAIFNEYRQNIEKKGLANPDRGDELYQLTEFERTLGDGGRFLDVNDPTLDDRMFLSGEEAGMLNNAAGLLGKGDLYFEGKPGEARAGLRADALRAELNQLLEQAKFRREANRANVERQQVAASERAAASGNPNAMTGTATGGNEGVTGSMKKPSTPTSAPAIADSAKKGAGNAVKSNVDKAKEVVTAPVKKVQQIAAAPKKAEEAAGKVTKAVTSPFKRK